MFSADGDQTLAIKTTMENDGVLQPASAVGQDPHDSSDIQAQGKRKREVM
jgi:hypothetical protein